MIKSKFLTIIKIRFIIKLIAKKQKVFAIVFLPIDTDVCLEGQDTLKDLMLNINKNPLGYILGDILFLPPIVDTHTGARVHFSILILSAINKKTD